MTHRAFTLLEMMLVLVILALVSTLAIPTLRSVPLGTRGSQLVRVRSESIRSGRGTRLLDSAAFQRPIYASPDGVVLSVKSPSKDGSSVPPCGREDRRRGPHPSPAGR